MTNGLSRETHHHLLLILILFLFINFLFLPFNRLETRLCLLKNSKSIIYSSSIHHLIIYSSVLRCLSATLGFDSEFGLVTANFVFYGCKDRSFFRCLLQKMRLKILITNKNRINETLKNPEKCLFGYVFCLFLPLF